MRGSRTSEAQRIGLARVLSPSGENQTFESYLPQPAVKAAPQGPIVRGGGLPMLVFGDLSPAAPTISSLPYAGGAPWKSLYSASTTKPHNSSRWRSSHR